MTDIECRHTMVQYHGTMVLKVVAGPTRLVRETSCTSILTVSSHTLARVRVGSVPSAEASLEQKERFNRFLHRVLAHAYNRTTHVQSDREPKAQM